MTLRRISAHLSMSVNSLVPHVSGPRWSAGRPPSRARSGESDRGCDTFRPPVGYLSIHARDQAGRGPGEKNGEFGVDLPANFIENTLFLHRPAAPVRTWSVE